jgi:methylated-DNA-[protein]-cysteine S-methyltransferase
MFVCTRSTPFGPVHILWSSAAGRPLITRVLLSPPPGQGRGSAAPRIAGGTRRSCSEIGALADDIVRFLLGEDISFSLESVQMDLCPPFQNRVIRAEHRIPRGMVSTYNRIANHIGNPGAARAVGGALAGNPFPIIVPCHRAIRSDRTLGGYQGGLEMKRALLRMEGVEFDARGRAVAADYFY